LLLAHQKGGAIDFVVGVVGMSSPGERRSAPWRRSAVWGPVVVARVFAAPLVGAGVAVAAGVWFLAAAPAPLWVRWAAAGALLLVAITMIVARFQLRRVRDARALDKLPAVWWGEAPLVAPAALRQLAPDRRSVFALPHESPESAYASFMRSLAARLKTLPWTGTVLVAPVSRGDGATTTALALAACVAQRGGRVLVVDADFQSRGLSLVTDSDKQPGLWEVLFEDADWRLVCRRGVLEGVDIIPAGGVRSAVSAAVTHPAFERRLRDFIESYDLVLVDGPAAASLTDTALLAARSSATVLVARSGRTTIADVRRAFVYLTRFARDARVGVVSIALKPKAHAKTAPDSFRFG